jgi:hypothetical protein
MTEVNEHTAAGAFNRYCDNVLQKVCTADDEGLLDWIYHQIDEWKIEAAERPHGLPRPRDVIDALNQIADSIVNRIFSDKPTADDRAVIVAVDPASPAASELRQKFAEMAENGKTMIIDENDDLNNAIAMLEKLAPERMTFTADQLAEFLLEVAGKVSEATEAVLFDRPLVRI